jgi:RNA polymerase sigma-70 factor (ECF subfamily)
MGVPHEDAADIVQETMLRLWRELIAEKDVRNDDAWAFRTAYRLAVDQVRRARRSSSLFSLLTRQPDQPHIKSSELEDVAVVWHEVDALPHQQRAVLFLRYRADLPFEQVGQAVGVSAATARTHATRALATLRERLTREKD